MYLRILKKDLKRKKTMNVILLVFITLATLFIASSVNNMVTVSSALDHFFAKARVPDYWFATADTSESERFEHFAGENGYSYQKISLAQLDPENVSISGDEFEYSNSLCISTVEGSKVFDSQAKEITTVKEGEIYVPSEIFHSDENDFYRGCKIVMDMDGEKHVFTLKDYTKDALFGSAMVGMTRFLVSKHDFAMLKKYNTRPLDCISVYTDDTSFQEKFSQLDLRTVMNVNYSQIKLMYLMDMLIAAIILVVSVCLLLISMVILHFTIHFTMSEEFREIGIMKAVGIRNYKIRGLYIIKYLAISVVAAGIGLLCSFPFEKLLLAQVSQNIILSGDAAWLLNILCAVGTAAVVVGFCYFCTRQVNKFSPIDAIHNGETGERYSRKGLLHLSSTKLPVVPFLSFNDITSSPRGFLSMIVIFTIGILLIILPVNSINTLRSDQLIHWFNMSECDHVISQELLFTADGSNRTMIDQRLNAVREMLEEHHIEAGVCQEIMFRFGISHGDQKVSSLAFQGVGDVTTEMYRYLEGTPPKHHDEVAISYIIADQLGAEIGDEVVINVGEENRTYIVTAINQSMNNLGEGIRFCQDETLDYSYAAGCFGIQIKYQDQPDQDTLADRKYLLKKEFADTKVYTAGEYISYMIGDVAGQLEGIKSFILVIILCINILVAVLMVRSFIIKEKSEIAILKAIGFRDMSLISWQTMRIGVVLLIAVILGILLSSPLSHLVLEPVFRQMGAHDIQFEIRAWEVYVCYPLLVLAVTVCAACVSAQSLRSISSAETSNIDS